METDHSEPGHNSRRSLQQIAIFQPLICYLKIIFLFEFTLRWHLKLRMINLQKGVKEKQLAISRNTGNVRICSTGFVNFCLTEFEIVNKLVLLLENVC